MSPQEQNTVRTFPFFECVLLITDAALYCVRFDTNDKVSSFERVDLRSIVGIMKGTYITSTLAATETDTDRNVGFVIRYKPKQDITRVNTRTLSSAADLKQSEPSLVQGALNLLGKKEETPALKVLAFKALPVWDSSTGRSGQEKQTMSEKAVVEHICDEIRRAVLGKDSDAGDFVEDHDIISMEEARKNTGLIEQWSHSLKKMVWA